MLSIAESSLADVSLADTDKPGFKRYIKRTPLGVMLVIAPWKYVAVFLVIATPDRNHSQTLQLSVSRVDQLCSTRHHRGQRGFAEALTTNTFNR